ncbi:uncharacterized protein LOC110861897 [Folsomia candida]|nr:uncharacterized protein LOC110861897 [Folsomia candida]XP_035701033.1 uncharacterized protein LOC110861897 [Folsomia candida]
MSGCVFCAEASVATTATSTTMEAYPFICAQVGLSPTGGQSPAGLCSTCHDLWEEVTLLYSNMQGLLNLMRRRVTSIKQRVKVKDGNKSNQTRRQGKRSRPGAPPTCGSGPDPLINWRYPQTSSQPVANTNAEIHKFAASPTSSDSDAIVKLESVDFDDCLGGEEMDLEDVEIMPDPGHERDDGDDDDDDLNDPSYDPIGNDEGAPMHDGKPKPTPRQPLIPQDYPPIETLVSEKGKPMISVENYLFNLVRTSTTLGKLLWACGHHAQGKCGVRLHTTDDATNPKFLVQINTHNHPSNEGATLVKKVMNKIRTAALTTTDTPLEIIRQFKQDLKAVEIKNGKKILDESIKRSIRKFRKDRVAAAGSSPSEQV